MNKLVIAAKLAYEGGEEKDVTVVESEYESGNSGSVIVAIRDTIDKIDEIEKTLHDKPDILKQFVPEFRQFTIRAVRSDGTVIDEINIIAGEEYQIASKAMGFLCSIFTYA